MASRRSSILFLALALAGLPAAAQDSRRTFENLLRKHDTNKRGWLSSDQVKDDDLFRRLDRNHDGRLTAADFMAQPPGKTGEMMMMAPMMAGAPMKYYGLKSVAQFDLNHDGFLDKDELKLLLLVIADGDEDHVLSEAEAVHLGALPGTSFREGWFGRDAFKAMDANQDGAVTLAELHVPDAWLNELDTDRDGRVSFNELARAQVRVLGGYIDHYAEISAAVGAKQKLDRTSWPGDANLFARLDADHDQFVTVQEFDRHVRELRLAMALASDFIVRYDIDGDGRVSRAEFPGPDALFARMDRNGDGFVSDKDR